MRSPVEQVLASVAVVSELRQCKSLQLGHSSEVAGTPVSAFCCPWAEGKTKHSNPESGSPEEKGIADLGNRRSEIPCVKWVLSSVNVN